MVELQWACDITWSRILWQLPLSDNASNEGSCGSVKMFVLTATVVDFEGLSSTILSVQDKLYLEATNDVIPVLYTALLDSPKGGILAPRGNSNTP